MGNSDLVEQLRMYGGDPILGGVAEEAADEIKRLNELLDVTNAQLRALSNELIEARANDRTTMGYLSSIRQAVEFDGDFPALVEHCRDLWQSMQHPSYEVENRLRAENYRLREERDELLVVLKAIIGDGIHCDVVPHLHEKAIAAIARVKGGAT